MLQHATECFRYSDLVSLGAGHAHVRMPEYHGQSNEHLSMALAPSLWRTEMHNITRMKLSQHAKKTSSMSTVFLGSRNVPVESTARPASSLTIPATVDSTDFCHGVTANNLRNFACSG
jgi:hypothetical protein